MRVFTCSYSSFSLAIPMEHVSSIYLHSDNLNSKIQRNAEKGETYISLPLLFDCPDVNIRHGIILRNDNDSTANKVILLSSKVELEKDITVENIYPLPKIMGVLRFSLIFNGLFFSARHSGSTVDNKKIEELVLLLSPQQLVQNIQKELIT